MGLGGLGGLIGGHTSTLEHLQSNLKQRDGEVYHLNWEMNRLQTQRNTLANEISEMSNQMEEVNSNLFGLLMAFRNKTISSSYRLNARNTM